MAAAPAPFQSAWLNSRLPRVNQPLGWSQGRGTCWQKRGERRGRRQGFSGVPGGGDSAVGSRGTRVAAVLRLGLARAVLGTAIPAAAPLPSLHTIIYVIGKCCSLRRRAFPKFPLESVSGQYLAQLGAAVVTSISHGSKQPWLAERNRGSAHRETFCRAGGFFHSLPSWPRAPAPRVPCSLARPLLLIV